ncbi:LCP family protein [Streptomyces sp. NPDC093225]|uniref:LCP family protein n=1 Tax=Streptomyces sp. NPDC093225 TaxID=3366034 RepID=UPI00380D623A
MRKTTVALTFLATLAAGTGLTAMAAPADAGAPERGRGTNILVVGIDSRAGLSAAEKRRLNVGGKGCNCTDVMLLVHLSQDERRASVVSIPRDSYVAYAQDTEPARLGKINGAYALGGRPLTVKTVEKATGLRIDHYLETGFTGFEATVDNLGGAVVCSTEPLKDENSGLDLTAGVHRVDGRGALRYVRARHITNRPGDLGRMRRQQRTVSDLLTKLTGEGALADPLSTARTVRTLLKTVRTDDRTDLQDLVRIGWAVGRLSTRQTEFATVPLKEFDHRVPGVGSTLLWHDARSQALWAALAADRPITGDPRIQPVGEAATPANPLWIAVRVDHAKTAAALRKSKFAVTDTSKNAPAARPAGPPVIRYAPGRDDEAATLAAALPGARLEAVPGHDAGFDVAVGTGPAAVRTVTYDRNVADGAPATGDRVGCAGTMGRPGTPPGPAPAKPHDG